MSDHNALSKKTRKAISRLAFCLQSYEHVSEIDEAILMIVEKCLADASLNAKINDSGLLEPVKVSVINNTCGRLNNLIMPERRAVRRETVITIEND